MRRNLPSESCTFTIMPLLEERDSASGTGLHPTSRGGRVLADLSWCFLCVPRSYVKNAAAGEAVPADDKPQRQVGGLLNSDSWSDRNVYVPALQGLSHD